MANFRDKFFKPIAVTTYVLEKLPKGKRGITKIYFVDRLPEGSSGPACCLRSTGECWINRNYWKALNYEQRVFILLHENAHISLDSSNEKEVDREAHKQYLAMGLSLNESVRALTKVLSFTTEEHKERAVEQTIRAAVYDITVNGNTRLLEKLKSLEAQKRKNETT